MSTYHNDQILEHVYSRIEEGAGLGRIIGRLRKTGKLQDLLVALKAAGDDKRATMLLARISSRCGLLDEARAAYKRLQASDPENPKHSARLAQLAIFDGDLDEADRIIRTALIGRPRSIAILASRISL